MRSSLSKDTFRDIKKTLSRFLSIVAIVAIGVAFFSGIKVASPDMKITADAYYDDQNFMDIQLISTLGLTDDDVNEVRKIEGVKDVFPTYSLDVLTSLETEEIVLKIHGFSLENSKNNDEYYINKPTLVEGRYPEKSGECVIEASSMVKQEIPIGTTLEVTSGTDEDISSRLKTRKFTVVGTVHSPTYVSLEKGSSSIGNGKVNSFMIIPNEDFNMEAYTEIFLTVQGTKELETYSDKYDEIVNKVEDKFENLGVIRSKIRYEEVISEASGKIATSKEELQDGKVKSEKELKDAEDKLKESRDELTLGESQLIEKENQFNSFVTESESKILNGETALTDGEVEYNKRHSEFIKTKKEAEVQFKTAEEQLSAGEAELKSAQGYLSVLETKIKDENLSEVEKQEIQGEILKLQGTIEISKETLNKGRAELDANKDMISEGEKQLSASKATIDAGRAQLETQKAQLSRGKETAKAEFAEARSTLAQGKIALAEGEEAYKKAKEEAKEKIQDGEKKLAEAEEQIGNIKESKWYVLDRNANYSFVDYEGSADRVNAIAQVFPVFFFVVAALVCLTTMTRMVDEQRGNIGTLKALGYSKGAIASKYIIYAALASVAGSILGIIIGFTVFPTVIFNAYGIMYNLPPVILTFNIKYATISTIASVLTTTLAAVFACYRELVQTPSILMRPKAPAEGKRILLEKIPIIWDRFNFIQKVSARNIFRYKKRFLMTVIGIAGCTALLLAGFGIKDSIKAIVDKQFGEIYKYDMMVDLEGDMTEKDYIDVLNHISGENRIEKYMMAKNLSAKASKGEVEKDIKIFIPSNLKEFNDFILLRNRKSKHQLNLSDDGIVISEKLAKQLEVKVGDSIYIDNAESEKFSVKITGITEHYVFHYAYMTPSLYEKIYGEKVEYNHIISKISDTSDKFENSLAKDIIDIPNVVSVNFNSSIKNNFGDMIKNLNYVVIVMIISAGSLAFVVLYNLTNVNISERLREIATIKVLGFYDNEVSAYVYRENFILTFIGMICGLILGVFLHRFIMVTAEVESMMFGRNIARFSYIWSALLTILFTVIVNIAMYYKLRNIPMVESLKSVD
ncbi:FtsX-like permease family protein [Clostridium sp.]|uniref:FtsX-like permease family protein n=1 Tax=Clostridium sp. TaxID=1506 RepID=UPI0032166CD8